VPRDASETRARLLAEAERLFAIQGVYASTLREIVEAAGQRNVSALSYHFGSREGVLWAILQRHGDPLDEQRGRLVGDPIEAATTRQLVGALLVPMAGLLIEPGGRNYLRIVAQLADRFPAWRMPEGSPHLHRILTLLERRSGGGDRAVQRERVVNAIMLLTAAMAERAKAVEEGAPLGLDAVTFVATLADMIVGGLEAPMGPPLGDATIRTTPPLVVGERL
jgi:TetR/AcrR family transcriptional regulator, regulator of cefoperazone and chloramphenicol sensitivity